MTTLFRSLILIISLFGATVCLAADTWLCKEEASQRRGNAIYSCGIGQGSDENEARIKAFDHAKDEFGKVCDSSKDCIGHEITVVPQRTSCEQKNRESFQCYRLVVFTIGEKTETSSNNPTLADNGETFEPFTYEQVARLPKVKLGMSKEELFKEFGAPKSISEPFILSHGIMYHIYYYGKMCVYESMLCHVVVEKGKVIGWKNFKPIYDGNIQ